jgi:hypothetical protein
MPPCRARPKTPCFAAPASLNNRVKNAAAAGAAAAAGIVRPSAGLVVFRVLHRDEADHHRVHGGAPAPLLTVPPQPPPEAPHRQEQHQAAAAAFFPGAVLDGDEEESGDGVTFASVSFSGEAEADTAAAAGRSLEATVLRHAAEPDDRAGTPEVQLRQPPAAATGHRGAPHGPGGVRAAVARRSGAAAGGAPDPTRPPPPPPPLPAAETAAEKQRKLLEALEKCDEDLKTLRRIISAVHAAASDGVVASVAAGTATMMTPRNKAASAKWLLGRRDEQEQSPSPSPQQQHYNKNKPRGEEQYQSPDSVLDIIVSSPRFPCRKRPSLSADHDAGSNKAVSGTTKIVKPSRTFVFSGTYVRRRLSPRTAQRCPTAITHMISVTLVSIIYLSRQLCRCEMRTLMTRLCFPLPCVYVGEHCKTMAGDELPQPHTAAVGAHHHHPAVPAEACTLPARLPRAESWRRHRRWWELEAAAAGRVISRATAESVGEVWGQQAGGAAEWECGWVAAALERVILQDMVSDVVAELLAQPRRRVQEETLVLTSEFRWSCGISRRLSLVLFSRDVAGA